MDPAASAFPATRRPRRLSIPARVNRGRIVMRYAVTVGLYHLVALLALLPWLFSWTGVVVSVLGLYVFGSLGINLYFHRLLTHRGFVVPRWVEYILGIIGTCCVQDTRSLGRGAPPPPRAFLNPLGIYERYGQGLQEGAERPEVLRAAEIGSFSLTCCGGQRRTQPARPRPAPRRALATRSFVRASVPSPGPRLS